MENCYYSSEKKELIDYINANFDKKPKGTDESNLINLESGGNYILKDDHKTHQFFALLEQCRRNRSHIFFMEKQNKENSGIMLDFDFAGKYVAQENFNLRREVSKRIIQIILKYFKLDSADPIHVGVFTREGSNNFHLIFPCTFMSRIQKRFLIDKIISDDEYKSIISRVTDCEPLDRNCKHVPVFLPGNTRFCNGGIKPIYDIEAIYYDEYDRDYNFSLKKRDIGQINVCHAFSINFSKEFHRATAEINSEYNEEYMKYIECIGQNAKVVKELDNLDSRIDYYSISDNEYKYIRNLMGLLAPWRADHYNDWKYVLMLLSNLGEKYKELADRFSRRCDHKYKKEKFNAEWKNLINKSSKLGNVRTISMLQAMARDDNAAEYNKIKNNYIRNSIFNMVHSKNGFSGITHAKFAKLLHVVFGNKYMVDKPPGAKKSVWYEFVNRNDSKLPGEAYKWRRIEPDAGYAPVTIERYMSNNMPHIIECAISGFQHSAKTGDDKYRAYAENAIKHLKKNIKDVQTDSFIKNVVSRCRVNFYEYGVSQRFNTDAMIIGVNNGVLRLNKMGQIKLIQQYHEHLISIGTTTNYRPFNLECEYTIFLLKKIRAMFKDETTFNWFMHFLGHTFDGRRKIQSLLILSGLGNNGKSLISDLYTSTFGTNYSTPLLSELLTRDAKGAENATPAMMQIKDKHLVVFSEIAPNETINTAILKRLLGAEKVTARDLYEGFQNFEPKCGFIMLCNSKPRIETTEEATWKRIKLIKMPYKFYHKNNVYYKGWDPSIKEADPRVEGVRLSKEYKEAFMSIVSFYWQSLQINYAGKMENVECHTIDKAVKEYRYQQDHIETFLVTRMVALPNAPNLYMNQIISEYKRWHEYRYRRSVIKPEIESEFRNSKLSEYIYTDPDKGEYIKNARFLAPAEAGPDTEHKETYVFKHDAREYDIVDYNIKKEYSKDEIIKIEQEKIHRDEVAFRKTLDIIKKTYDKLNKPDKNHEISEEDLKFREERLDSINRNNAHQRTENKKKRLMQRKM